MPKRRNVPGICWAIDSVRCCLQTTSTRQTSRCCLFQRTRRQRRGHPHRAVAPCVHRSLTSACCDPKFAVSKSDRLHVHIRELHRCGTVRQSMANAHGQIDPRHWCFLRRRHQSLPQSRHRSPSPWPLVKIEKAATTQTRAYSRSRFSTVTPRPARLALIRTHQ